MRAVLINVHNRSIYEVEVNDGLKDIYKHIGCDLIDVACNLHEGPEDTADSLYVDDEGLCNEGNPVFEFKLPEWEAARTFAGNGLVLGVDFSTGESIDAGIGIVKLANYVNWTNLVTTGNF
jgi:hypothetical protein